MRRLGAKGFDHIFLALFSFIMIYPVIWWVGASLKKTSELSLPTIWPSIPMWENYSKGWRFSGEYTFAHFFGNTLLMELGNVAGGVLTAAIVAYGFGRLYFGLKGFWFSILLLTMMLPGQVTVVPQYILFNKLGLVDSYVPLVLPHFFGGGAFFIFCWCSLFAVSRVILMRRPKSTELPCTAFFCELFFRSLSQRW